MELQHRGGSKWIAVNEDGMSVKEFHGKREQVETQYEAWLHPDNSTVELPDPSGLAGRAKTEALNTQMKTTFVPEEYSAPVGVHNEANKVFGTPAGFQPAWATPRDIDGGAHANYLRSRGYRPVEKDEMCDDMGGDGMYVTWVDEDESQFVYMNGAQLMLGHSDTLAKLREHEYRQHMEGVRAKSEETQERAAELGDQPVHETRESSPYSPMRSS